MAAASATLFDILNPLKNHKLWPEAPGGTIKPFSEECIWSGSTGAFICKQLMPFQFHIIIAAVDTLWVVVCGVFASPSLRSMEHYNWWKVIVWTRTYHYHFLPSSASFFSFAEHDQMIITAEQSALQSGFHG